MNATSRAARRRTRCRAPGERLRDERHWIPFAVHEQRSADRDG